MRKASWYSTALGTRTCLKGEYLTTGMYQHLYLCISINVCAYLCSSALCRFCIPWFGESLFACRLPDGRVYCGTLVKGELQGLGELHNGEGGGVIYEGSWFNNVPHGRGTLKTADGEYCMNFIFYCCIFIYWCLYDSGEYEGEFSRGRRHGKGLFTFYEHPTANGRNRTYEGDWKDDKPHGLGSYLAEDGKLYTYE